MTLIRKIIYWFVVLLCAVAAFEVVATLIDNWDTISIVRKCVRIFACLGWVYITYNVVTLRYKWLRKLTGNNN